MTKLTMAQLREVADLVAYQSAVIVAQRDPRDQKMDERSALLHKLWIRISGKINLRAGGFANLKDQSTHEQVLLKKIEELLSEHLETPMGSDAYQQFLDDFLEKAFKQLAHNV